MGAASSKQGRYVVNPDPGEAIPVNYDPSTPYKPTAYRVVRSSAEVVVQQTQNGVKSPEIAASVRYHTYPEGYSTHKEKYYSTHSGGGQSYHSSDMSLSHDSRHSHMSTQGGNLDSEYYSQSKVSLPSAETLTCTAPLSRRGGDVEETEKVNVSGDVCIIERDNVGSDNGASNRSHRSHVSRHSEPCMDNSRHQRTKSHDSHNTSHGSHDTSHGRHNSSYGSHTSAQNLSHGHELENQRHQIDAGIHVGENMKDCSNSDKRNNNIQHNADQLAGSSANAYRLYASINPQSNRPGQYDYPSSKRGAGGHYSSLKPHPKIGGSIVHLQEDGKMVTHFLPYTASTPRQQGFESTSLFIPYITSTPNKQFQMMPETPPDSIPPHFLPQPPLPTRPDNADGVYDQQDNQQHRHQQSKLPGSFTIIDALFLIGSMVMYMADIVLDIMVAVQYYQTDKILWSGLTMAFIIIPSLTLQYFSLRWHFADTLDKINKPKGQGNVASQVKVTLCTILAWLVTHILQLGAINRYWRTLKYGWRSRSDTSATAVKDYNRMICEYRDTTMLRLLEAFMESAPQLVLQLYIMTQLTEINWLTAASAIASLASLSWSLEAYHKALRESDPNEKDVGWCSLMIRMAAHTFLITARVISLALFAAYFQWWVFVAAGAHWLLMTLWLIFQKTTFCSTPCEEVLFDAVIGIVHIFSFFNMKPNRTRYRALGYYTLVFIENTVMFALWYKTIGKETMYGLPALVLVWGGFFLGIVVLLFYYRCCHPLAPLPLCNCTCLQKDSIDAPVDSWDECEIDGVAPSHPAKDRGKKVEGNLFSRQGRRHLYWTEYPLDKPDLIQQTQPLYESPTGVKEGALGGKEPTEQPTAFLETSLL